MTNIYKQIVKKSDMTDTTLEEFKNKVLLIVNVAVSYTHLTLPTKRIV